MLTEKFQFESLADVVGLGEFVPYPAIEDRAAWDGLAADLRESLLERANKLIGFAWPVLPAVGYMEFDRNGNRSNFEQLYFKRRTTLSDLVIAECVEGENRFIDDIINGVWCICEESTWVVPAHNHVFHNTPEALPDTQHPFIDLFSAETAALLGLVFHLLHTRLDAVSPRICERIRREISQRILTPYIERDFWWMGFDSFINNWTVWCNSNCLLAFMLTEESADRRVAAVKRAMRITDNFIDRYPSDGGCDEGPGYWTVAGGSLFDCLEHLYAATRGKIDVRNEPIIREIGRYIVKAHISDEYMINFADASACPGIDGSLVYRYGKRIEDAGMMALGAYAFNKDRHIASSYLMNRTLAAVFTWGELTECKFAAPLLRDVWLKDIQVMAGREQGGTYKGLFIAAKGGHNAESHNHNDVGHYIIYIDGKPAVIDVGVGVYTKQTFSSQRYDIWTMQSQYHNLPTVNGVQQAPGAQFKASDANYYMDDSMAQFSLNIASAYPENAGIVRWDRTCALIRGESPAVEMTDDFILAEASANISLSIMTPCKADLQSGVIRLNVPEGACIRLDYDSTKLSASIEPIEIDDARLAPIWGPELYRIQLVPLTSLSKDTWKLRFTREDKL